VIRSRQENILHFRFLAYSLTLIFNLMKASIKTSETPAIFNELTTKQFIRLGVNISAVILITFGLLAIGL
jgi:hypothetical protein